MNQLILSFKPKLIDGSDNLWMNSFCKAISELDILSIENLIEDDAIINDQSKWDFLATVRDIFKRLTSNGSSYLIQSVEKCMICNQGCPVLMFRGKEANHWVAFYIAHQDDNLKDITICNLPTGI